MRIENVKIVDPFFTIENGWVEFNDKIISYGHMKGKPKYTLMPGFVDTHVHGGMGYDFVDDKVDFEILERHFFSMGVTSVLATTLTLPIERIRHTIDMIRERMRKYTLTPFQGVHLEGPFISSKHIGAQNPAFILRGTIENVKNLVDDNEDIVKIITIAPEECDENAIDYLQSRGVTVSIGHSNATFAQFTGFYNLGVKHMTHFCNAMTPLHHREIGLVGAGLKMEDVDLEIISDGIHLNVDMLSLILKFHSHDHIIAITDAMRATGLKDGEYDLGGLKVTVSNGSARLENGSLAGSVLKYNDGLKRLKDLGLSMNDISKISAFNASKIVKNGPIGRIMQGYTADMVLINEDFSISKVFKKGKIVLEGG